MNLNEKRVEDLLRSGKPDGPETPPFLRGRIMNAVKSDRVVKRSFVPQFAMIAVALVAVLMVVRTQRSMEAPATLTMEIPTIPNPLESAQLEKPFETEIRNLQEDTRNAARALAASFMPGER